MRFYYLVLQSFRQIKTGIQGAFKKNQSQKKKNPWIPLVVIVVLALLMVLLNYFMLDVTNAVYHTQQENVQTESTTAE